MKRCSMIRLAGTIAVGSLALTGCASGEEDTPTPTQSAGEMPTSDSGMGGHDHEPEGGPPPEGIEEEADPTYAVGETVVLTADHMSGMEGTEATISGAFETTTYSVSYTPTNGGDPVTDHKWVVHEELENPDEAPLGEGAEVVLDAEHMSGMAGAEATIDSSTDETVYMVDFEMEGMEMTNHKWVVESEVEPAE